MRYRFLNGRNPRSERTSKILSGSASGLFFRAVNLLLTLILTPLIISKSGVTNYGTFSILLAICALFSFLDLGIGYSAITFLGISKSNKENTARQLSNVIFIFLLIAIVILLSFPVVSHLANWHTLFKVPNNSVPQFQNGFNIIGVSLALGLFSTIGIKILQGLFMPVQTTFWTFLSNVLSAILLFLVSGPSAHLSAMVFSQIGVPGLIGLINLLFLFIRYPEIRPKINYISKKQIRQIIKLGRLFMVLQIAVSISYQIDTMIIGHYLNARQVATYASVWKFYLLPSAFFSIVIAPLWSGIVDARANYDLDWIRNSIRTSFKFAVILGGTGAVISLFLGTHLISLWTNGLILPSRMLIVGMSIWIFLFALTQPISMILNAYHAEKILMLTSIFSTITNVILSVMFINYLHDSAGAIFGSIISQFFIFLAPQFYWIKKYLLPNLGQH